MGSSLFVECLVMQSSVTKNFTPTTKLDQPKATGISVVANSALPSAEEMPKMTYTLGTDTPWPDQGLNRILATIDSFDTSALSEIDCLEMLFYLSSRRQDSRKLAEAAIERYGSLAKVFAQSGKELREKLSIDYSMTAQIAITKSSLKYILSDNLFERKQLLSYAALMDYLSLDMREAEQEILRVIYLDAKNKIIKDEEMARGTVDSVSIYPKEIAKRAMCYCASAVVLAHNHLADDPTPTGPDVEATIRTKGALELLDIVLHDHVIVARKRCFSMKQAGRI